MNSDAVLERLRQFLLIISAGIFVMTTTELIFVGHWTLAIQYLPFALCAFGLALVGMAYFWPSVGSIGALRWSMIIISVLSFIGFFEHIYTNYTFWLEIQPEATAKELLINTFNGGIPILAPGILLLGAVIGLLATYQHPLLDQK